MFDIFKTVFQLSMVGSVIIILLLILKPFTVRRLPAGWQYFVWLIAAICMIIPIWKIIPENEAKRFLPNITYETYTEKETEIDSQNDIDNIINKEVPIEYRNIDFGSNIQVRFYDLFAYIWLLGMGIYLAGAFISYVIFLIKKRRTSLNLYTNTSLEEVKKELGIKHKIRIRISYNNESPMLVGLFFPVIYIPQNNMSADMEKMVFRHELTHYKRKDLMFKWLILFVNAVHWFNPFVYLLGSNVSEACEISCDMAVISEMDEENKKLYMKTILDIAEKGGES